MARPTYSIAAWELPINSLAPALPFSALKSIFITHHHADHDGGFPGLARLRNLSLFALARAGR